MLILTLFNVKIMNKKLQLNPDDSSFHARVSVQTNKILTIFFKHITAKCDHTFYGINVNFAHDTPSHQCNHLYLVILQSIYS